MADVKSFEDLELDNKLKQYAIMKQMAKARESDMLILDEDTDEETITINQTNDESLVIEEED